MSEKLNRQKNADEKKMIVAQHREKQLEYERKRLTRNERAYWLSFFRRFSQSVVKTGEAGWQHFAADSFFGAGEQRAQLSAGVKGQSPLAG